MAGACGFLLKECAFAELVQAIRAVHEGRLYLSERVNSVVSGDTLAMAATCESRPVSLLSARENEVLRMMEDGAPTKEIAGALGIAVKTVETHQCRLKRKIRASNAPEPARPVIRHESGSARHTHWGA